MNTISLIGNLATEVDLKEVTPAADGGAKKVASFLLAVDRGGRDGGADFIWISAWDRQAELCAEYLAKGRLVALDGRLRTRTWEQDGQRRDAFEVVARRVEFLSTDRPTEAEVIPFEPAATA
jgi:single-strand DNA-binding protein